MRLIIMVISLLSFNVYSLEPNCSLKGTRLIYIPGALASSSEQIDINNKIDFLTTQNKKLIDYRYQLSEAIRIQSQGYLQSKFNYLLNSLGTSGEYAWFFLGMLEQGYSTANAVSTINSAGSTIQSFVSSKSVGVVGNAKQIVDSKILDVYKANLDLAATGAKHVNDLIGSNNFNQSNVPSIDKLFLLSGITKGLSSVDFYISSYYITNLLSLSIIEDEFSKAYQLAPTNLNDAYSSNQSVIDNIAEKIKKSLNKNERLILSPHGEGNQLAKKAIEKISIYGTNEEKLKLGKYLSIIATSPTTEQYTTRYGYMKHSFDNRLFGGVTQLTNYVIKLDLDKPNVSLRDAFYINSFSADSFLRYYISDFVQGKPIRDTTYRPMGENYKRELASAALKLESNCGTPDIQISLDEQFTQDPITGVYKLNGYSGSDRFVSISATDLTKPSGEPETEFKWTITPTLHQPNIKTFNGKTVQIPVETNLENISVVVTAVNSFGNTNSKSFEMKVDADRPIEGQVVSQTCLVNPSGYTSSFNRITFNYSDPDIANDSHTVIEERQETDPTAWFNISSPYAESIPQSFSFQSVCVPRFDLSLVEGPKCLNGKWIVKVSVDTTYISGLYADFNSSYISHYEGNPGMDGPITEEVSLGDGSPKFGESSPVTAKIWIAANENVYKEISVSLPNVCR